MQQNNPGFDQQRINQLKEALKASGKSYQIVDSEDNNEEFVNFRFVGMFEGKEVIYDAVIYTLRLHHASEVYEVAEHKAAQKFPNFRPIRFQEDENGDYRTLDDVEEEIGLYIAETIDDLEDEESVKVQEHVDLDENAEYGIGLDIGLHIDEVNDKVIAKFIKDFNDDNLNLDDTYYAFQSNEEELDSN
jgi:hypothetical protein